MNDPKVSMYYRTEIAKWLMNNNHEPRPVDLNIKVIIEGIDDPSLSASASVSVALDPVPKIPLLNARRI
jgi:hypothetical protein